MNSRWLSAILFLSQALLTVQVDGRKCGTTPTPYHVRERYRELKLSLKESRPKTFLSRFRTSKSDNDAVILVPVYIAVICPTQGRPLDPIRECPPQSQIDEQIRILNQAHADAYRTLGVSSGSRFEFIVQQTQYYYNDTLFNYGVFLDQDTGQDSTAFHYEKYIPEVVHQVSQLNHDNEWISLQLVIKGTPDGENTLGSAEKPFERYFYTQLGTNISFQGIAQDPTYNPKDDHVFVHTLSLPKPQNTQGVSPKLLALQGDTLVHEVGHWLGLDHVFDDSKVKGCRFRDILLPWLPDDTPAMLYSEETLSTCIQVDTCPNQPGNDPVQNYMSYASDACMTEFTRSQYEMMQWIYQELRLKPWESEPRDFEPVNRILASGQVLLQVNTWTSFFIASTTFLWLL